MSHRKTFTGVWLAGLLLAAGCERTAPSRVFQASAPAAASTTTPSLVACPVDSTVADTAVISSLGGTLSVDGSTVSIPAGALLVPTPVVLTVPASQYMEVDVSVPGVDHFLFQLPVTIGIDYSRCQRSDIDQTPLSAWYIDSATKALLQDMGGTDDKTNHVVTFSTLHLSGYAIAD